MIYLFWAIGVCLLDEELSRNCLCQTLTTVTFLQHILAALRRMTGLNSSALTSTCKLVRDASGPISSQFQSTALKGIHSPRNPHATGSFFSVTAMLGKITMVLLYNLIKKDLIDRRWTSQPTLSGGYPSETRRVEYHFFEPQSTQAPHYEEGYPGASPSPRK